MIVVFACVSGVVDVRTLACFCHSGCVFML